MSIQGKDPIVRLSRWLRFATLGWGLIAITSYAAYWLAGADEASGAPLNVSFYPEVEAPPGPLSFVVVTVVMAAFVGTLWSASRVAALYEAKELFSARSVARLRTFAFALLAFVSLDALAPMILINAAAAAAGRPGIYLYLSVKEWSTAFVALLFLVLTHILSTARAAIDENDQFL